MKLDHFDSLLDEPTTAAIVMRQHLKPVEGEDGIIYPPTFADIGYNIDELAPPVPGQPRNVCLIDSVGSQANRMEPRFKDPPYNELVPQIDIHIKTKVADTTVHLFDAGHRIADAVARCTEMAGEIEAAFLATRSG
ncbi:hypothetical protein LCGC14_2611310, partial [marine sediment metagenome]